MTFFEAIKNNDIETAINIYSSFTLQQQLFAFRLYKEVMQECCGKSIAGSIKEKLGAHHFKDLKTLKLRLELGFECNEWLTDKAREFSEFVVFENELRQLGLKG